MRKKSLTASREDEQITYKETRARLTPMDSNTGQKMTGAMFEELKVEDL